MNSNFPLAVNYRLCMAPMVGLSNIALRELCQSYLPPKYKSIWPTEMLNSRRLPYEKFETTPETLISAGDHFLVPQILGNEEHYIKESVKRLKAWGASGIDINMGCPVARALRHNYGVALMGDPQYAADVVKMTVDSSDLPVSVKLRAVEMATQSSPEQAQEKLYKFTKLIQDAGAKWITLHPRSPELKRRGFADWEQVRFLKKELKIPIIGNGDIQNIEDAIFNLKNSNCDMIMVGRALTARPWLFAQFAEATDCDFNYQSKMSPEDEGQEYAKAVKKMAELCQKYFTPDLALRKFRFFVKTGSPWLEFGHSFYALMCKAKSFDEINIFIDEFFSKEQRMSLRTQLRE